MGLNGKQLLDNFKEDEAYGVTQEPEPSYDDSSSDDGDNAWKYLSVGDIKGWADYTNRNYNYRSIPFVGQIVGHAADAATQGIADAAQFVGATDVGDYLNEKAQEGEAELPAMSAPELSLAYLTDPNGLASAFGMMAGSMVSMAPAAAILPELLPARAAAALGRIPAALSTVPKIGGTLEKVAPMAGRWALTGPVEAMMEGGNTEREMLQNGATPEEAAQAARDVFAENVGLLTATNALEGGLLGKLKINTPRFSNPVLNTASRVAGYAPTTAAEMALQGYEEGAQQGIQNGVEGESPNTAAQILNPFNWTGDQWDAAKLGIAGAVPLMGAMGAIRHFSNGGGSNAASDMLNEAQADINAVDAQQAQEAAQQAAQQATAEAQANPYQDVQLDTAPIDTASAPSYDSSVLEGDPQYTISGEVSSTDVTPLTDEKMRLLDAAYYQQFGRHLYITSMKRNGDGSSWHDSGQAFDTADDNLEGDADARAWLINKGAELGLVALDEYEHPSAHATGGHIHFSDHGDPISGDVGISNEDMGGGVDLSNLPVGNIAMAISQNTGLPANLIWAQLAHESADGTSQLAQEDHNYGGVKGTDGNYLHFDSDQEFIDYMSNYYPKYREDGIFEAKNADEWAEALKHGGYFTAGLDEYEGGMKRHLSEAGLSESAMSGGRARGKGSSGNSGAPDLSTTFDIDADDSGMRDMFSGFASEWRKYANDQKDVDFFGNMFDADGNFEDTPENRIAIMEKYGKEFQQYSLLQAANDALRTPQGMNDNDEIAFMNKLSKAIDTHNYATIAKMIPQQAAQIRGTMNTALAQAKAQRVNTNANTKQAQPQEQTQAAPVQNPAPETTPYSPIFNPQSKDLPTDPISRIGALGAMAEDARLFGNTQAHDAITQEMSRVAKANGISPDMKLDQLSEDQQLAYQQAMYEQKARTAQAIRGMVTSETPENLASLDNHINSMQAAAARIRSMRAQTQQTQAPVKEAKAEAPKSEPATNYLASLPDSAIATAKMADDGVSVPLNIFSPEEQEALRKAGIVHRDDTRGGGEFVYTEPLYQEADRRMGFKYEEQKDTASKQAQKYKKDIEKIYLRFKTHKFSAEDSVHQIENLKKKVSEDKKLSADEKESILKKADDTIARIKPQEAENNETQNDSKTTKTPQGSKAEGHQNQNAEPEKSGADAEESEVNGHFDTSDYKNEKTGKVTSAAKLVEHDKQKFSKANEIAEKNGGKYNSYAKRFFFKNDEDHSKRDAFVAEAENELYGTQNTAQPKKTVNENQQEAKQPTQDISDTAKEALSGTSKEAQEVYRIVRDKLAKGNDATKRAADVSAIILARHADAYAKSYSKATGEPYTAMDYLNDKLGIDAEGNFTDKDSQKYLQSAWHGSPYDFDKFDLDKIGAGEGAQAHGWGLYFAKNREVSEGYLKRLSNFIGKKIAKDGLAINKTDEEWAKIDNADPLNENTPPLIIALKMLREVERKGQNRPHAYEDAITDLNYDYLHKLNEEINDSYPFMKWYKEKKYHNVKENIKAAMALLKEGHYDINDVVAGKLFKVDVPEESTMLDEQKTFDEQPQKVRQAIDRILHDAPINWLVSGLHDKEMPHEYTLWEMNQKRADDAKYQADLLREYHDAKSKEEKEQASEAIYDYYGQVYENGYEMADRYTQDEDLLNREIRALEKRTRNFSKEADRYADGLRDTFVKMFKEGTGRDIYYRLCYFVPRVNAYRDDLPTTLKNLYNQYNGNIFGERQDQLASLLLNAYGVKGISYIGGRDGRCYVVFDDKAISIINKYNQDMNGAAQGSTSVLANGKRIVSLMESADESTFLHEMGHVFMLDLQDLASIDEAAARDMATVENWTQWKKGQAKEYKGTAWEKEFAEREKQILKAEQDGDEATASDLKDEWAQERFARGLERYLESGKAPSSALKAVFERFKQFLTKIYEAFKGDGGKPSDDVQNVMARMMDSSVENKIKVPKMGSPIIGRTGREVSVTTDSGKTLKVRYRLVPAGKVITSHDANTMTVNKAYPQELQPRDRQRVSMQEQVTKMANTLRPADLGAGRNLNQGAPIIRKDGVVLNGNGRAMAIQKHTGGDYQKYLIQHAKEFGFTPEMVRKLNKPMLVREVVGDINADTMQDIISSTAGGSRMGASEQAKADAKKIKSADLDLYSENETGDLTTASNRDFVAGILHRITGDNEQNAYTDSKGNANADGIQRVKRALFSLAYGDDDLISKMAESTDDNIRNVSNGLMNAAPAFAKANLDMRNGDAHKYDAAKTISDAVKRLDALRQEGKPVKDYLNEQSMFSEYQDTDEMREVLRFFDENKRSGKKIGTFLREIADLIERQGNPKQITLGDVKPLTLGEIITKAEDFVKTGDAGESLFAPTAEAKPAEEKPKKEKKVAKKEAPKAEQKEDDDSIFGSVGDADAAMLEALGLTEEDLADDVLSAPAGIENTAAERERLEKALREELEKDSSKTFNQTPAEATQQAKPKFNPKIYTLGLKLAMTYVKDGINTAKKLVAKLNATFGEDKIGPWAPALAETVRTWPSGVPFDENKVKAISQAVGARYERGTTTLDGIQDDMKKRLKGQYKTFAPMIEASYNGIKKFFDYQKGESENANDSTSKLAERAGRGTYSDRVGTDDGSRESGTGSKRESVQETGTEVRPFGSVRVRDGSTASRGTSGNRGVQVDQSDNSVGSTGSAHMSGSVKDSYDGGMGTDDGRSAESAAPIENRRDDEAASRTSEPEVSSEAKGRAGNINSIKKDLPMLRPEQQGDVEVIEKRLGVGNKSGIMITNGTGTGKTYSGLGYIKRLWNDGKKDILIVAPSDEIITQWVEAAKNSFKLDVYKLESTEDKGPDGHICITTYANLQSNKELVNHNWDAIVADEAHNLMNNKKGEDTGSIRMLRALTLNPRGLHYRIRLLHRTKEIRALEKKIDANNRQITAIQKAYKRKADISKADTAKIKELENQIRSYETEIEGIYHKILPNIAELEDELAKAYPEEKRPKALFLSATPFAYDKDTDYAEGYLFNYEVDTRNLGRYNSGSARDNFMIKNFGYRMRTGKLTSPEKGVDHRVMEVQFHDNLVKSGAMYGRQLEVDKDYDRGFILVDGGIGHKIDEGFDYLAHHDQYRDLREAIYKKFDARAKKYLLESIKAQQVIRLVNEYVKEGKKVVIFHQSMKEKENIHPFQITPGNTPEIIEQWESFRKARPDLVELSLSGIPAPMQTFRKAFGDNAVYVNGDSKMKKNRETAVKTFNNDNSGVNVIICQQDAANAGISLHDTTGKHPRVLINIAMPERPSYAMQIEGRIYRVGNASNAVFRYLSTGTNIEKEIFADTIGGHAETVENLAMGDAARGLHDSFTTLYQETMDGSWKRRLPGNPEEGTGGKEMDRAATSAISEYDRAKSFYYSQQKKNSRSKSQEGHDYYATPEPIGYKMVEWLGLKSGDKALEPSAGHGAISRWFSPTTDNVIIEQSSELEPIAKMNTPNAKAINGPFENFNIVNKFDGIAMNPPYGVGGKTAMEHLQKAISHLRDHGRVIAILPEGPAADKRYAKMMEEIGDKVVEVAQIHLPQITFKRAGTGVATKIVILDHYASKREAQVARDDYYTESEDIDLRDIDDINELFDRMENMEVTPRPTSAAAIYQAGTPDTTDAQTQVDTATAEGTPISSPNFETGPYEHTKTHEILYRAKLYERIDNYGDIKPLLKRHNGYFSKFAKGFLFHTEADRNAFVQEADAILGDGKFSANGKVLNLLKKVEYIADEDLTEREKSIQEFGQQMGMKVVFFNGPSSLNGYHSNGVTFLNRNAAKSVPWTFWHESFHWLRNNNPELYRQMVQYISGKQEFSSEQLSAYREAIGRPELSDTATIEEMMADAMPEVSKRVSLFRDMGKENKSLLQRFIGWIRDTMAAFHNALAQAKYGLTSTQKNAMRNALANIARDLRDSEGNRIFRVVGKDRTILAADGSELSYKQTPDEEAQFSADTTGKDGNKQEPAGSPSRMRRALIKLGFAGEKNPNIEIRENDNKNELNLKDMSVKSVRQVSRKNAAVKYMYRLGRKAIKEQEHLRNMYMKEMQKFNSYVKKSKDLKETAQLLWESDAAGHAYTAEELSKMGVSPEAAHAYMLARKLLADAYKRVNDARMQVMVRNKVIGQNDLQSFIRSNFLKPEDIIRTERFGSGKLRVTYRGAKVYEKNDVTVGKDEYARINADRDIYIKSSVKNADGTYTIDYTERIKPMANREGYMPHFFHNFMVYEKGKNEDGTERLVTIGSANSLKKAIKIAQEASGKKPEGKFVIRPQSMQFDEDYNNIVVGDRDYIKMAKQIVGHTEMSWQEANDFLRNTEQVRRTNRHRFFGNAQHRTGAAGFEKDVQWALTHYLNASARYVAMEHFKPDAISFYERFFGAFKDEPKTSTAKYIKEFINDMNGTPRLLEKMANEAVSRIPVIGDSLNDTFEGRPALAVSSSISSFNAVTKLGLGNFASAAINFMQFVNIGTKLNSYGYAMKGLKKALKPSAQDKAILEASGVMDEQNLSDEAGGYSQTRDYGRTRKGLHAVKYVLGKTMVPFQKADALMRRAAILGGYYQGVEQLGMKPADGEKLSRAALDYAEDVNLDANFDYSVAAAPRAMRMGSVFTQQLFQFQKYPIMQFEFFWNEVVHAKNNKQRARFLVPYCLLAGAVGAVPFGALINLLLSTLIGALGGDGDDYDLAEELKAELMKWAGKDPTRRRIVNTFLYGMMSNIGINISERVGMSNAFSGEYYGNKPQSAVGAIAQAFGGPLVSTAQNLAQQCQNHNPIEAIKAVSPALGNILQAFAGETRTTHHRVGTVYNDMWSRVMHGLGFRSTDETNDAFVNNYLYKSSQRAKEDKKDAMDAYIRNPSSANKKRMKELGVTDKSFQTYKENLNKSSKQRMQDTKPSKKETAAQKENDRLKAFTH